MKIQNKISQNMLSKKDLKEAMQSIKTDIKDALGEQIHEEISKSFLENIAGIAEIIKENFSQMRESTQQNFDGLKNDIAELKAKDDLI
jgi:gas vesicle protein